MKTNHILVLAALALAGCDRAAEPVEKVAAGADLTISDGRLVLPAVAGNPGAAYFKVTNGTAEPASLAAASIEGAAKAEMHETSGGSMAPLTTLTIGPGATASFERGGKHVMAFGLPRSLEPGGTAQMTLTFAGGATATGPLQVEAAGGGEAH
jgi:copper(I)-binding protein